MKSTPKPPIALFKGKKIIRVLGGYKIIGSERVFRTLPSLTDSIR